MRSYSIHAAVNEASYMSFPLPDISPSPCPPTTTSSSMLMRLLLLLLIVLLFARLTNQQKQPLARSDGS